MPETVKRYVTTSALTHGIEILEIRVDSDGCASRWAEYSYEFYPKTQHFGTRSEAIADAIKRRDKKIKSLKAQISRLESLTFDDTPEMETTDA